MRPAGPVRFRRAEFHALRHPLPEPFALFNWSIAERREVADHLQRRGLHRLFFRLVCPRRAHLHQSHPAAIGGDSRRHLAAGHLYVPACRHSGTLLFNMLTLWMFGAPVEQTWGTRRFLQYYFICGVGAGVCVVLANLMFGNSASADHWRFRRNLRTAAGFRHAVPESEILLMFLFPMKAKYVVMIFGAIAFLGSFQGGGTVSNLAHLGGMLFGFVTSKPSSRRAAPRQARRPSTSTALVEGIQDAARAEEIPGLYEEARSGGPGTIRGLIS